MNNSYTLIATAEQVNVRISSIASSILNEYPTTPLFVGLLHGAAPFAAKLMFEIAKQSKDYHPDFTTMIVSTYGDQTKAGEPHIVTDLPPTSIVKGKEIIVLDDVLDKGITTDFVMNHLRNRGAADVKLAVLCDKKTERERNVSADYLGFRFEDKWLVGMGMDDASMAHEGYRWLEDIWEIDR